LLLHFFSPLFLLPSSTRSLCACLARRLLPAVSQNPTIRIVSP
jgi:hypothetical protein